MAAAAGQLQVAAVFAWGVAWRDGRNGDFRPQVLGPLATKSVSHFVTVDQCQSKFRFFESI